MSLLKLRKFREEQVVSELGKCNQKLYLLGEELKKLETNITSFQERVNSKGRDGKLDSSLLLYFSDFIRASLANRDELRDKIKSQKEKQNEILERLAKAKAEVKVIENLKDKNKEEFMKMINKIEQKEIEENYLLRKGSS